MWSRKFQYALRGLIWLAQRPDETVSVREIAEGAEIPHKYLETILHDLRGEGIVTSRKGPRGGYTLAEEATSTTLFDVLSSVDREAAESLHPVRDAVGDTDRDRSRPGAFLEGAAIAGLNDLIARRMTATTIADALDSHLNEKTVLNYVI
jgi:Rrf2 family protein